MDRALRHWYDDQTDNYPYDDEVVEVDPEDAIDWCNACAGPILEGQASEKVEAMVVVTTDRHGDDVLVSTTAMAWHLDPSDCTVEG